MRRYGFLILFAICAWLGVVFNLTGVSVGDGHARNPVVLGGVNE